MTFKVEFKHTDGLSIEFRDPLANANTYTNGGSVTIAFRNDDEAHAFFEAVEQEQAARYGDMHPSCPICGGPLPCQSCLTALRCDE